MKNSCLLSEGSLKLSNSYENLLKNKVGSFGGTVNHKQITVESVLQRMTQLENKNKPVIKLSIFPSTLSIVISNQSILLTM